MTPPKKLVPLPTKAPSLAIPPVAYNSTYLEQLLNSLRLYFNQIDNSIYELQESSLTTSTAALLDGTAELITNNLLNVSAFVKNGTGDYTITFTTPLATTNYAPVITLGGVGFAEIVSPTFSSLQFRTYDSAGVAADFSYISLVIVGGGFV